LLLRAAFLSPLVHGCTLAAPPALVTLSDGRGTG
jgi:hypothetical protein